MERERPIPVGNAGASAFSVACPRKTPLPDYYQLLLRRLLLGMAQFLNRHLRGNPPKPLRLRCHWIPTVPRKVRGRRRVG